METPDFCAFVNPDESIVGLFTNKFELIKKEAPAKNTIETAMAIVKKWMQIYKIPFVDENGTIHSAFSLFGQED